MNKTKKDVIYSFADQVLFSLTNLGIGLFLIHFTTKHNYGLYSIGISVILLTIGFANALITTQMTVIAYEKPVHEFDAYCFSMLVGQYIVFIPVLVMSVIGICYLNAINLIGKEYSSFALTVCFSAAGVLLLEFLRRYFFLKLSPKKVLLMDIIHVGLMFTFILTAVFNKYNDLHKITISAYGGCAFIAGILGAVYADFNWAFCYNSAISSLKEAWINGRWALGGVTVTWLQSQGYVMLLSILITAASVAEANAARLFLAPVGVLSTSLIRVFMPRLAILRSEEKHDAVKQLAKKILILILAAVASVSIIVILFQDIIIKYVFTKEYTNIGIFIAAWAIVYFFQAFRSNTSILLQVYKQFKIITLANTVTSISVIIISIFLIKFFGIIGSISGLAIGELLLFLLLWRVFRSIEHS